MDIKTEFAPGDDGGVIATVMVDHPAKLNVLDQDRALRLAAALRAVATREDLRVCVLRGAGDRALIGGADIEFMANVNPDGAEAFITSIHDACDAIRRMPVPVIARMAGHCHGAGLEIAAACDLRIADENTVIGMPEVQVGLPSVIEAALLPRLIGWGRTSYLVYTGKMVDAKTGYDWGMFEQLAKPGQLDEILEQTVKAVAQAGPQTIRLQKELCRDWEELPMRDAIQRGIEIMPRAFATGESQDRMRAFMNRKR
ncbi:MAG: enoyl-CoA hydratase/isomerase family protein [Gammaproteobacteria bacterium]|nr:enoyl-CoA hydratase/isomerase family protein [Gammaproteobacteria bacterium]